MVDLDKIRNKKELKQQSELDPSVALGLVGAGYGAIVGGPGGAWLGGFLGLIGGELYRVNKKEDKNG